jgi:hypothetical protein
LTTAGLTLVLQDFIIAFFGWFVLMGKHGIRVGDWVEINGVGGEVTEIGLFRTTLLETGNWTDKGHPTGRRITILNSFAIRGQYFNFSTAGQWMWDEISVSLPPSDDALCAWWTGFTRRWSRRRSRMWKRGGAGVEAGNASGWAEPVQRHAFGESASFGDGNRRSGAVCDAGFGAV